VFDRYNQQCTQFRTASDMATTLQSADSAASTPSVNAELAALLHSAGIAPLDSTGWIRVTGSDRVRWLNGMVTNTIQSLTPGEGCYNFVLNAQGRIQGDLTAFLLEDSILLETSRDQLSALIAHFDHFIIMDDVELADISDAGAGILLAGPQAASILSRLGLTAQLELPIRRMSTTWNGASVDILCGHSPLVPRYELWSTATTIAALNADLNAAGAAPVSPEALEHLRILEGTPRYGVDIRNSATVHDLPQETAQTRALHFSKGCYLGQEIVERIRSRGNVHRTFSGFSLTGSLPAPGTAITAESFPRPVGELTSVAAVAAPAGNVQLALGYIRREAIDRGLTLKYPGGTARPIALPYALSEAVS
jgi:folate-binding protein YgfZ